ncbi:MAG: D-alanyl-D-alanine carboxypeptidase [Ruminococcus sp.]|nr:D-alanyl-D-alanine carboxypeptidase [Ruminococcus sp.]
MLKKRLLSFLFAVVLMLPSSVCGVSALGEDEITAPSAVLMEPSTKKILFEKNPHDIRPCASITKVMTLILVFEAIESGKLDYTDLITSSAHAASMGGSDIWLEEGESMTVDHMIKAVVVASANDAAVALAEAISGTEEEFVNKMNEKAKVLGMNDTTFKNCNGLDEEGHLTSAYDVALMSAELITHEKIFDYSSIWIDTLRGGETQIVNTNKLLKSYKGITGLKTGTTSGAGSCMSATAERDGMSLVAVVLGCDTGTSRFSDAAKLMDYGFANYMVKELTLAGGVITPVKVKSGMKPVAGVTCDISKSALLPKSGNAEIESKITVAEELEAPVEAGTKVGKVSFLYEGSTVDEFDIVTTESVEKISFKSVFGFLLCKLFEF